MKSSLLNLSPGQKGVINAHRSVGAVRQRLLDLGLVPQMEIEFVRYAPLGDPIEIRVKGYSLSLRKEEAVCITVEVV